MTSTFADLGISSRLLEIMTRNEYINPTPIQEAAIPAGLSGDDVIGIAQTGTGKTLAFGVPMLELLSKKSGSIGLIIAPTRELAMQIEETIFKLSYAFKFKTALLLGGASMRMQMSKLQQRPQIIIATPGRLIDHMQQGTIKLGNVAMIVLDEADRMLDIGFAPQVKQIMQQVPADRQTMLFSATLSREIQDIANRYLRTPMRIEIAPQGKTADRVTQEFFIIHKNDKARLLEACLIKHKGQVIVFSKTKHGASKLSRFIRSCGINSIEIHGNKSLSQRTAALDGFKKGKFRVLVATDIAARGIDVKDIELVLNYDLPQATADYVHRIGRTARNGASGHAISFATPDERRDIRDIERLIQKQIAISTTPELPERREMPASTLDEEGDSRGGRFGDRGPRRSFGDRPSFGGGDRSGSRPAFGGGQRRSFGDRPAFGSAPRPQGDSAQRSFGGARPAFGTSRPSTGGRPAFGGDRGGSRPAFGAGQRRSFGGGDRGARPAFGAQRRPFGERAPNNPAARIEPYTVARAEKPHDEE
jgi:ATP-dependent RNA helicase RhlE